MNAFNTTADECELRAEVSKLEVGPDDYVLIRLRPFDADQASRICKDFGEMFPGRLIVMAHDLEVRRLTESDRRSLIEGLEQMAGRLEAQCRNADPHPPHHWRRKPDGSWGDFDDEGDLPWCLGVKP